MTFELVFFPVDMRHRHLEMRMQLHNSCLVYYVGLEHTKIESKIMGGVWRSGAEEWGSFSC